MKRGRPPGNFAGSSKPSPPTSSGSPQPIARFLFSCGYRLQGHSEKVGGGWVKARVVDRATGEDRGTRWVQPKPEGGYRIQKVDPKLAEALKRQRVREPEPDPGQ